MNRNKRIGKARVTDLGLNTGDVLNETSLHAQAAEGVMVHGAMWYRCGTCFRKWRMWLERGLEERLKHDSKPVPFTIRCKCGKLAQHVNWECDIRLNYYLPRSADMDYFKNDPAVAHGIPILIENGDL